MWRNSRLTTPQKRQSDCRRLGHSRLRVASRFTLRIGLASWPTQPPSQAKIAGGPPSLGVHEPSDSPQVTSCHSGTPLCDRPKLTKLSARGLCKLRAEHYWTCPLFPFCGRHPDVGQRRPHRVQSNGSCQASCLVFADVRSRALPPSVFSGLPRRSARGQSRVADHRPREAHHKK